MEEYNCRSILPYLLPLELDNSWKLENSHGFFGSNVIYQDFSLESNVIYQIADSKAEWIHVHQTPSAHAQFFAWMGYTDANENLSASMTSQHQVQSAVSGLKEEPYQPERYFHFEENFISLFSTLEHQVGVQKREWSEDYRHALQFNSGLGAVESPHCVETSSKRSREKAFASNRSRRLRIAHAIDALRELVPHNKEVGREAFVDIVIDHVKHLQNQMKELCQSRLSGESSSAPVTFIEGHGHYIVQEQMLIGPLEETLGEMFTVYPSAADSLLQSKGLVVMPMCFADGLCENNEEQRKTELKREKGMEFLYLGDLQQLHSTLSA